MAAPPSLGENAMTLLKVVASSPGLSSRRRSHARAQDGSGAVCRLVTDLAKKNLLQISGSTSPDKIDFATFAVHPSNFSFVRSLA